MMKKFLIKDFIKNEKVFLSTGKTTLTSDYFLHGHDFSEIVIILSGKGTHIINGYEYHVTPGNIAVINGDITHSFVEVEQLEMCNIKYDIRTLMQNSDDLKKISGFQALFVLEDAKNEMNTYKNQFYLNAQSLNLLDGMLNQLISEFDSENQGYETILQSLFMMIIVFLSREYSNSKTFDSSTLFPLATTVSYMERNYFESIKLEDLAAKSCLSVRQFIRVFHKNFNTTPINYINNVRLKNACRLLSSSNLTITQIAMECGFGDANYFTRIFKKKLHITPSEYREYICK